MAEAQSDEDKVVQTGKGQSNSTRMHVKIHAPYKTYFDGEATSITAENDTGVFDVLAQHHNFMTILRPCEIHVRADDGDQKIQVQQGVMHVKADEVVVFLDV
ncbi:MAG: hypothetical protein LC687_03575 [Actinobacteria bacterium]|nr:hypothetical protein [Actinomycetota bacterium]